MCSAKVCIVSLVRLVSVYYNSPFHISRVCFTNSPVGILCAFVSLQNLQRGTLITDQSGKTMPALDVFGHAIAFLKGHLLDAIRRQFAEIEDRDIKYVLTVPAIWDDTAKQFMREAARKVI